MSQEPPRPVPQSVIQASGQVATEVVAGLKQQPALLAVVVMNLIMVVSLFWFMSVVNENVRTNREQLMAMISRCLNGSHRNVEPGTGLGRDGRSHIQVPQSKKPA